MSQQTWTPLRGYPDWLMLGESQKWEGWGGGVKISPISYIYREGVLGGRPVTNRRGGGYRTHTPYPRLVPSTIGPGVSGDDFQ